MPAYIKQVKQAMDANGTTARIDAPTPAYCYGRRGYLPLRKKRRKEFRHWRKLAQSAVHPYAAEWEAERRATAKWLKKPGVAAAFGSAIQRAFNGRFA